MYKLAAPVARVALRADIPHTVHAAGELTYGQEHNAGWQPGLLTHWHLGAHVDANGSGVGGLAAPPAARVRRTAIQQGALTQPDCVHHAIRLTSMATQGT